MLGIRSFIKNEVIHRCSSRILVALSAGSFTAIFKLEVLLSIFCGTKITLEWNGVYSHQFIWCFHYRLIALNKEVLKNVTYEITSSQFCF